MQISGIWRLSVVFRSQMRHAHDEPLDLFRADALPARINFTMRELSGPWIVRPDRPALDVGIHDL